MIRVVAAVVVRRKRVLLLRKANQNTEVWYFPGGKMLPGESAQNALRRELKEELGRRRFQLLKYLGDFMANGLPQDGPVAMTAWLVEFAGDPQLSFEHSAYAWVKRDDVSNWPVTAVTRQVLELLVAQNVI